MMASTLPDFLCVGAQKAGTTSLFEILRKHPDIYLPREKEIHFFDKDCNYQRGVSWYSKFFESQSGQKVIGEITPDYMLYEDVPERILETLGSDVKFVFVLRHPVHRAYSQYNFHRMHAVADARTFESCIDTDPVTPRCADSVEWHTPAFYLERSLYHRRIESFLRVFPVENIFVTLFEELFGQSGEREISRLLRFLNVRVVSLQSDMRSNPSNVPRRKGLYQFLKKSKRLRSIAKAALPGSAYAGMRNRILNAILTKPNVLDPGFESMILERCFRSDIQRLELLLGRSLSVWYEEPRGITESNTISS
jgi:hypothetical protein